MEFVKNEDIDVMMSVDVPIQQEKIAVRIVRGAEKEALKIARSAEKDAKKAKRLADKMAKNAEKLLEKASQIAMKTEEKRQREMIKQEKRIDKLNNKISKEDIVHFKETFGRGGNDDANDKREDIVIMMLNNRVPQDFVEYDIMWGILTERVRECVHNIIMSEGIKLMNHIEFVRAGGRGKHYDIEMVGDGKVQLKIEFKHGASDVLETPQFVSPMKPSQYMTSSFEDDYYNNYLPKIVENDPQLIVPEKDIYMKQIHNNEPKCMIDFQNKYYAGCERSSQFTNKDEDKEFYNKCNETSKTAIKEFLSRDDVELCHEALSTYFIKTQEKVYLMYKDGQFRSQRIDPNEFVIDTYVKEPENYRFVVKTKTGKKLHILLRWKNGNGIAFPAFQISLK